ncbi:serine/threonine protein kinase, partial [bacterium]|nr:serine/threonine protein kinase [bacterium]
MAASAADRYEIVTELGRGGMGVVYKARDSMLGRVVALKRVLARDNKLVIKRFLGEAKSIAALNHPNIIQIYDIGEDAEGLYITTEFVEGTDLYRLLRKKGALEGKVAIRLVIPICKAMAYAHARGVIHRDIKPANVLLTADGMPKIADFGLARLDDMKAQEMTGMVMGTQSYASPEQFKDSKHVDHRTDIYSIGAMFFEMLTGIRPQHFRESAVPDPFKQVVLKALEHDRARRYQQLEEMIRDLDALRT